jgi:hypothetical protein
MLHRISIEEEKQQQQAVDDASLSSGNLGRAASDFEKLELSSSGSTTLAGSETTSNSSGRAGGSIASAFRRRSSSTHSTERRKTKDNRMARWLNTGNVIYKSVGLGLMDLSVGLHLVDFAKKKGIGTHVEGF